MRPGQLEPNEFESAILTQFATQEPWLGLAIDGLRVLSREFTGVGTFTKFACDAGGTDMPARQVVLDASIRMPGVQHGMGAVLFCKGNQPDCLEVFTYGEEQWDGVYDGFLIQKNV